jgi:predicted HTH transcriptional regulator
VDGKNILALECERGLEPPYSAPSRQKNEEYKYFIRQGSTNEPHSIEDTEVKTIFNRKISQTFLNLPSVSAKLADIDINKIREYLKITNSKLSNRQVGVKQMLSN